MSASRPNLSTFHPRQIAGVAAVALLIKAIWLVADPTLRVYMGDSMVYLQSAALLTGSGGRSFLYGWVLHFVALPFGPPVSIIVVQAVWSVLICLALYVFLRYALGLRYWLAAVPAWLLATEPAQVFMERMVMAETLGLLAFVTTVLVFARYLATGRLGWYLLACLGGLAATAFRTSFLPVAIGLAVVAPVLYLWLGTRGAGIPGRQRIAHFLLALVMLVGTHTAYVHAYGLATHYPPGYLAYTGMMRIGLVAPLIRPEHFEGTGVSGEILKEVKRPLQDHWQRGHHIWEDDGLWPALQKHSDDPEAVARTITRRAMLDDPLGLVAMNLDTMGGYFEEKRVYWRMQDDKGVIAPAAHDIALIKTWTGWDPTGIDKRETPARRFFAASTPWLTFCLFALAPLGLLTAAVGWRRPQRVFYLLLALASLGLVANHVLFAHIVSFRYLHPFSWFVLANLAVLSSLLIRARPTAQAPESAGRPGA
ncbi:MULTISPECIES: glycosyltransferase family 39 protein [Luteimonas]|uniref:glycosyltransferase family 39 protein n=1 Tax=Luteimonas TaxID=83614 RepID=UPI00117CC43A|nr:MULTISPECIES: glycosyltransferase family 39 protein [Luteimonas]